MSSAGVPPRTRQGKALFLTLLALAIGIGAYALVAFGKKGHLPVNLSLYGPLFAATYLAAHILIRRVAPHADQALFPTAGVLTVLGFAIIFRLDGGLAAEQSTWVLAGIGAFAGTLLFVRDHRQLDGFTYTILLGGVVLLLLPVVPGIGREINGARLWVKIGPIGFQPAELAKVLIVVFLASYLARKKELLQVATVKIGPFHLPQPKHLGPVLLAWGTSLAVLFLQKDLGASLLFFAIFVVMLWVATARLSYVVVALLLFAVGAWVGYQSLGHVQERVDLWLHALDPSALKVGASQLAQGQFAMASGGVLGSGLGMGVPYRVPYAATDFIFAAIGEELGLVGAAGVLLLYLALVGRGLRAAVTCRDDFGKLLAAGLSSVVALQAFVIVGGVTRLIPLTGVTLPFVSYGGSSLVANFILLALLVRVSAGPAPAPGHARAERRRNRG